MVRLILFFITLASLFSCNSDNNNKEYLPKMSGKAGELLLVMDSVQWRDTLGREVRRIFEAPVPGLPQDEPMFKVIWVHPTRDLGMLNQLRNLVYVFTLDQTTKGSRILQKSFSEETINKIKNDTSFYLASKKEEYARGQEVMYLFGNTQDNLIKHLRNNKQSIIDYFNKVERNRLQTELFTAKSTQGITEFLKNEQGIQLKVPAGYKLADRRKDFVWLRNIQGILDKDIFISWKPYTSEFQMLPDSIISWRDEIAKKYLFEDPDNINSYLVTEQTDANVNARQVSLNGRFAMELRGLWRTNNRSMGGPFVSYALVDEPRGLIYYIEGFAYAPGSDKREMVRELESILWSFKTIAPENK